MVLCEYLPLVLESGTLLWTVRISYTSLLANVIRGVNSSIWDKTFFLRSNTQYMYVKTSGAVQCDFDRCLDKRCPTFYQSILYCVIELLLWWSSLASLRWLIRYNNSNDDNNTNY
jgi:hypothetical protein